MKILAKFVNNFFSEVYTGKDWLDVIGFIQTGHFCGTQNVPFVNLDKKVGHFLSYFSFLLFLDKKKMP